MISQELLSILGCPGCPERPPLTPVVEEEAEYLACGQCGRHYPILDNIPVMLVERARRRKPSDASDRNDNRSKQK